MSKDYLTPPQRLLDEGRWEPTQQAQDVHGYTVPSERELAELRCEFVPDEWVARIRVRFADDGIGPWRHLLIDEDPSLQGWVEEVIQRHQRVPGAPVEAIFVWNNCAALSAAAQSLQLPLIHWELGNLRLPQFVPTVYMDLTAVNGNTECERRFRALELNDGLAEVPPLTAVELLKLFAERPVDTTRVPDYELGSPLQLPGDSNLVAFSKGYDNQRLIDHCRAKASRDEQVLVRGYPGVSDTLPSGHFSVDDSLYSVDFIARCATIVTINSSVGAEAMLIGRPVEVLGESPYAFIARMPFGSIERLQAMRFYFLCYLVPRPLLFDAEYVRWRLAKPSEAEIAARHLGIYRERRDPLCTVDAPPHQGQSLV